MIELREQDQWTHSVLRRRGDFLLRQLRWRVAQFILWGLQEGHVFTLSDGEAILEHVHLRTQLEKGKKMGGIWIQFSQK